MGSLFVGQTDFGSFEVLNGGSLYVSHDVQIKNGELRVDGRPPTGGPSQFDVLDGVLALRFRNGYASRRGDTFTFIAATGGVTGAFDALQISGLAPGFLHRLTVVNGQVKLEALNDGVPAGRLYVPAMMRRRH